MGEYGLPILIGICVLLANPAAFAVDDVRADDSVGVRNAQTEQVSQVGTDTFTNGNITVAVNASGTFTMTANGTPILYPAYTSYLTVRVNETNYSAASSTNLSDYVSRQPTLVGDTVVTEWRLPNDVVVRQNVTFNNDTARFSVEVRNRGSSPQDVGVRYLFDYQVRDQDGAPLRIGNSVYINETAFSNRTLGSWEALPVTDIEDVSEVSLVGRQRIVTQPDRIIFANWTTAVAFPYEYDGFNDSRSFYTPDVVTSPQSDSSGLLYWNLGSIPAGESRSITTEYGASEPNESEVIIDFPGQQTAGKSISVDSAFLPDGGFLTVRNADGDILGVSDYIRPQVPATNVTIRLDSALNESQQLMIVPHRDTDGDRQFDFTPDGQTDTPYRTDEGEVITYSNRTEIAKPPNAVAQSDVTVEAGTVVTLDATESTDPNGDDLSYSWEQIGGPSVNLSNASTATPTFTPPRVANGTTLAFRVTVTDATGRTDTDRVNVTVRSRMRDGAVDTDDDDLPDDRERQLGTDPLAVDTDGDGLGDGYEVRVVGTEPKNRDTDGDGVNDYREVWVYDTDPLDPDDAPE